MHPAHRAVRALLWGALLTWNSWGQQAPVPPPPAPPSRIKLDGPPGDYVVEMLPEGAKATTNPARFTYRGWLYVPEGLAFADPGSPNAAKYPAPERRVMEALAVARNEGIAAVVPFWSPEERKNILETVTDPAVNRGMNGFLKAVETSVFLAKVLYGPYTIMLVQHIGQALPSAQAPAHYTLKLVNGQYFLTNDLMADPVFTYLTEKYVRQLVAEMIGQKAR